MLEAKSVMVTLCAAMSSADNLVPDSGTPSVEGTQAYSSTSTVSSQENTAELAVISLIVDSISNPGIVTVCEPRKVFPL